MDIEAASASASTNEGASTNYTHAENHHHNNLLLVPNDHEDDLNTTVNPNTQKRVINWKLLILFGSFSGFGYVGAPMLQRLYFTHGGGRKWLMSMLQTAGFPVLVAPLSYIYIIKKVNRPSSRVFMMEPKLFIYSVIIGVVLGFDNYMYSAGLFYLPVSTSSLLFSTQLAFTAVFAYIIVRQKFTFYSLNSVLLLTLGAVVLALNTSSDRPPGTTQKQYYLGFFLTLAGAALAGLCFPLIELAYGKSSTPITYSVVMQFQFVLSLFSTLVTIVGMAINKDFQVIPREGRNFGLGEGKYYLIIVAIAVIWQLFTVGFLGMIYCTSSLFTGIFTACLLPITQVAASIAFHEKFTGQKGMSLALCLWGFVSYFIGEYKKTKNPPHPIAIANAEQ